MNNYEFCADWAERNGVRVLDYGCGAGQIVSLMRSKGLDGYGCDVYYGGHDSSGRIPEDTRPYVSRMDKTGKIPFPDAHFDAVVSNQVMEHVVDMRAVVAEIARVLKPGGRALHLFPDRGIWREGHAEIPFVHWFRKGSTLRLYYAAAFRIFGAGVSLETHQGMSAMEWARGCCQWLDDWVHYRTIPQIHMTFSQHFSSITHNESEWMATRFAGSRKIPSFLRTFIARKWGGLVIEMQKS